MSTENKPLHFWVSLRHWKQFAEGKMHIAYTWDVDYKDAGCTLKFVEIAAVEQLKAENLELKRKSELHLSMLDETRSNWSKDSFNKDAEIQQLKSEIEQKLEYSDEKK